MFINMCWSVRLARLVGNGMRGTRFSRSVSNMTKSSSNSTTLFRLLGPPEIHKWCVSDNSSYNAINHLLPSPASLEIEFKNRLKSPHPCVEFFVHINQYPVKYRDLLLFLLYNSWRHDSLTTLKIIGYMKQHSNTLLNGWEGRDQFYSAALWLHSYHPKSLANNVRAFSKLGCLKDWLEILHRLVRGSMVQKVEFMKRKRARRERNLRLLAKSSGKDYERRDLRNEETEDSREEKRIRMARHAVELYNSDPNYRFLYDQISDLFAELLKSDLDLLALGDYEKISLASKWCPSIDSSYDRSTLFCEGVARRLFPYDSNPEYKGIEEAHYAYRVRHCLQKRVLVPLRRALKLPEIYMSRNEWHLLPYERVSITAMTTYKRLFMKHDKERFLQYIHQNRQKKKLAGGREMLLPHDIYRLLDCGYDGDVVEAQWKRMVQAFAEEGKFQNCIVAFEFLGLENLPKIVQRFSLSFQLLASELSESPWKGNILRQSGSICEFSKIQGDDLRSKMESLKSLYTSMKHITDHVDVWLLLDTILETAVRYNVSKEKMVRRLYLFGNLRPSGSIGFNARTLEKKIGTYRKKFGDSGFRMPDLVFWDMALFPLWDKKRDFRQATRNFSIVFFECSGIMKIYQFSSRCIQVFLEEDGNVEANTVMDSQISAKDYMEFKVHD